MQVPLYQVDAFTDRLFGGNPAGVCPLEQWLPDETMQKIAMENNVSETAFFVKKGDGFHIRWFTPKVEVNLCGHATLASAHVIFQYMDFKGDMISMESRSGVLKVRKEGDLLILDFPGNKPQRTPLPDDFVQSLNITPVQCFRGKEDYLLLYKSQREIESLVPDFRRMEKTDARAVIVTAPGDRVDFVSRFFAPRVGIDEDPVTGSAHTVLIPFWAEKLGKTEMNALQLSRRGGVIFCRLNGDRVDIGGRAVTFMKGEMFI
ncbi:MAG: PhzF family phenazine biosynthesis protein [Bacteroidales bacterium]|jgi:PhzF family phenazine biosynthesis protein|nr:PhzF family phenazine biosynthesis protein [Bacteroidales bacterium]